jgi:hypothetical protein
LSLLSGEWRRNKDGKLICGGFKGGVKGVSKKMFLKEKKEKEK